MKECEEMAEALEAVRRSHLVVDEDCWFSCPKSGECCADLQHDDACNCGADAANAIIDKALAAYRAARRATEES